MSLDDALPLYVGLTTLPSRIEYIRPTLDSLLSQTRPPDRIFLSLPPHSTRENCAYSIPFWLKEYEHTLTILRCDQDNGPGTKLLGCLPALINPACLILADDDMIYRPFFLEELYRAQSHDHSSSFSFWTYKQGPITVGQGADGFSLYTPNLKGINDFAARVILQPQLRVVDDLWISAFLLSRNINVRSIRDRIPDDKDVYEVAHQHNQLQHMSGESSRARSMKRGAQYLAKRGFLGHKYQLKHYLKKHIKNILALREKLK